jgi:hypothetical protein
MLFEVVSDDNEMALSGGSDGYPRVVQSYITSRVTDSQLGIRALEIQAAYCEFWLLGYKFTTFLVCLLGDYILPPPDSLIPVNLSSHL